MTKLLFLGVALISVAGCERVTEYKCSPAQIEAAKEQFYFCKLGAPYGPASCWDEAARAHCEIQREFMRTGEQVK